MGELLNVREVSKTYVCGAASVTAVDRVSFAVAAGQVVLILGPSGSGKTTLLSMLGGLLRPTQGEVCVAGWSLYRLPDAELCRLRCRAIGFVFQSFNLLDFLTARRNVEVVMRLAGVPAGQARERAADLLRQVQLGHRLDFWPRDLSGGERQRVSVARALANSPRLILADEPTGSLDSSAGRLVASILAGLAREKGSAVVIVTHDTRIVDLAAHVFWLADGALVPAPQAGAEARVPASLGG